MKMKRLHSVLDGYYTQKSSIIQLKRRMLNHSHMQEMPSLIYATLFDFLGIWEVIRIARVAKRFRKEVEFYIKTLRSLCVPQVLGDDIFAKLLWRCPNLRNFDISKCRFVPVSRVVEAVRKYLPNCSVLRTAYDKWDHRLEADGRQNSLYLLENVPQMVESMCVCTSDIELFKKKLPLCKKLLNITFWRTHLLPHSLTPYLTLPLASSLKFFAVDFEHNAVHDTLCQATSLKSLKLKDCGYDDPCELDPLSNKHLTKLELMHCPISDSLAQVDSSSLTKLGIDWCPVIVEHAHVETLVSLLARATKLVSLKMSAGSINHGIVSALKQANPIASSLTRLHINAMSTCMVQNAVIDDSDSSNFFSLFPPTLEHLRLCCFPLIKSVPYLRFPYLRVLELQYVNLSIDVIAPDLQRLTCLEKLSLHKLPCSSEVSVASPSLQCVVLDDCPIPRIRFRNCPKLDTVKFINIPLLRRFSIENTCPILRKIVVRSCVNLHHFLLSTQFTSMKSALPMLNCIKILDCDFSDNDVKLFLECLKTHLLCALVDFDESPENLPELHKISHQVSAACSKLCKIGLDGGSPKPFADISFDSKVKVITNFPFYSWIETLSNVISAVTYCPNWLFLFFKIHAGY